MSTDSHFIDQLGTRIAELLFEALHLQTTARAQGDLETVERIGAFIAGVSAAESACLYTDKSAGAFMLSRLDEDRAH